jgi:hypothetical protein
VIQNLSYDSEADLFFTGTARAGPIKNRSVVNDLRVIPGAMVEDHPEVIS